MGPAPFAMLIKQVEVWSRLRPAFSRSGPVWRCRLSTETALKGLGPARIRRGGGVDRQDIIHIILPNERSGANEGD